jgi:hypothetical protein
MNQSIINPRSTEANSWLGRFGSGIGDTLRHHEEKGSSIQIFNQEGTRRIPNLKAKKVLVMEAPPALRLFRRVLANWIRLFSSSSRRKEKQSAQQ